ncbi:hypothetical protein OIV83_003890 [Microbotryomycetes sp. JL201]|nr:hypothetical protein OIV83_003890 [Microbotryomycetes sp. JL201]
MQTMISHNDNWQHQALQWGVTDLTSAKWSQPRDQCEAIEELLPPLPSPPLEHDFSGQHYVNDNYSFQSGSASPASSFYQTPVGSASHLSLPSTSQTSSITPLLSQTGFDDAGSECDVETYYTQRTQAPIVDAMPRRSTLPELPLIAAAGASSFGRRGSAPQLVAQDTMYLGVPSHVSPLPSPALSDSFVPSTFDDYSVANSASAAQYDMTALAPALELSQATYRPRINSAPALQGQIPSSVHVVSASGLPASPQYLSPSHRVAYTEMPTTPVRGPTYAPSSSPAQLRRSSSNPGMQYAGSPYRLASHPYSPSTPRSFHGFEPSPEFYNGPPPPATPSPATAEAYLSPPPSPAARNPLNGGKNRLKFVNFSSSSAEDRVKLLARSSGVKGKKRAAALAAKIAAGEQQKS